MKFWPTLTPILALLLAAAGPAAKQTGSAARPASPDAKPALAGAKPQGGPGVPPFQVAMPPGAPKEALRRVLLKPYAAITGAALPDVAWDGASLDGLKPAPPAAAPDLVLVNGAQLQAGCKSQQFNKLDWARLNRDRFLSGGATDCGAAAYITASALAWDRDKLAITPTWQDFWDIARHPGRRGLQRTARGTLEFALLADGVAPGDIYRTLRTPEGQDRAFRKLDQLKPYLTWWDQPGQPAQMLSAGKVLLTSSPAAPLLLAAAGAHRHFGVQWAGSLLHVSYWAVPHDAPQPAQSGLALLVATDPARLAELAQSAFLGPSTRDALDLLPDAARAATPSADLAAGLALDEGFWAENGAKLEPRFTSWLAK